MPGYILLEVFDTFKYNINLCPAIQWIQQDDVYIIVVANPMRLIKTSLPAAATAQNSIVWSSGL